MNKNRHQRALLRSGFSLIELMVTITVLAILASIATSSYQFVLAKGDRATAISDIVEITQSLERYFSFNRMYTNNFADISMASANAYSIHDAQGLYNYYIILPGTEITAGTSTATAKPAMQMNDLRYTVYAEPRAKNRDQWTLTMNELGYKFYFASARSTETDKTAKEGWP